MGLFDTFCNLVAGAGSAAHDHETRHGFGENFFMKAPQAADEAARWHRQGNANEAAWYAGRAGESHRRGWW